MKNNEVFDSVVNIFEESIISYCDAKSSEIDSILDVLSEKNHSLVNDFNKAISAGADVKSILELSRDYQEEKKSEFNNKFAAINTPLYGWSYDKLTAQLDGFLLSLPKEKKLTQHKDRFYSVPEDSRFTRFIKVPKRLIYGISILPKLIWNGLLKIFKKQTKKVSYWKYRLPLRLLTERFAKTILIKQIEGVISEYSKGLVSVLKSALDKEQTANKRLIDFCFAEPFDPDTKPDFEIDLKEEKKQLILLKKDLKEKIETVFQVQAEEFESQILIAGTIEQPAFSVKYHNRKNRREYYQKLLNRNNTGWGNTAFGLFEDWKIDQEIFKLILQVRIELNSLEHIFDNNTADILVILEKSHNEIKEIRNRLLDKLAQPKANTEKEVKNEISGLEKQLVNTSINPSVDLIINQNFIGSINQFELKINEYIAEISDKKWLTKLISYDTPLKSSDLNSFSPHELLSFKYLPELDATCSEMKANNIRVVESFKQDITNISGIIAFNLSSILESKDFGTKKNDKILQLISEGFDRSINKLNDIKKSLDDYGIEIRNDLETSVNQFIESSLSLTDNENAFELRITVTKAKAIKRTLDIRFLIQDKAKTALARFFEKYKAFVIVFNNFIDPWKSRLGFSTAGKYIATELSDFLSDAFQKINRLPIVYQQLYRIQPLTEMNLFTGRTQESARLQHAFQSWKEGKYAPTVIIGEKWSGHTTLINYFIEKQTGNTKVLYENRTINISSKNDFFDIWKALLKTDNIETFEDLTDLINSKHKNKIIVIENIQNYYLRTINGFDCLNLFIKLISKTYHSVFWLCTANIYAWDYLNHTIEISNYFGYHIKMTAFTDDELRQLIMKKNNISGYKIIFQASQRNLESKKFNHLDNSEKQAYLQNQFFYRLNDFAKGNISLALSYWLLSTKNINEGAIEINYFESPDFSFISKLNFEKVFLIYVLIMHDGLTLEHLGMVLKKPAEKLQLLVIMLLDDGILIERKCWFEVNPLIYRHSINMLKMRNLIY